MLSMLFTIATREIRDGVRNAQFRWLAIGVTLLAVTGTLSSRAQYQQVIQEQRSAEAELRNQWVGQGPKDPHLAAHFGTYAIPPASIGSILDPGLLPYLGTAVFIEAHRQNGARYVPAADRSLLQRFGDLSVAGVMQLLLPLMIMFVCHGSMTSERELGMLPLVASQGVAVRSVVVGKAIGLGLMLLILVIPLCLFVFLVMGASATGETSIEPVRLILFAGITIGYMMACVLGGLLVSTVTPTSRMALIVLIMIWTWSALVAPRASTDLAEYLYPTPTAAAFAERAQNEMVQSFGGGEGSSGSSLDALRRDLIRQYGVTRVEDLPVNVRGLSLQDGEDRANVVWDRAYAALWNTYEQQDRVRHWMSLIAPTIAARSVWMALAGTDLDHHVAFARAAEVYRRNMVRTLNLDLAYHSKTGEPYEANPALWATIPPFTYRLPPFSSAVRRQVIPLVSLTLWLVLPLVGLALCRPQVLAAR